LKDLGDGTDTLAGCKPGLFWTTGGDPMSLVGTLQHNAMMYILDALNSMYEFEKNSEA